MAGGTRQTMTGKNLRRTNIDEVTAKVKEYLSMRNDIAFAFLFGSSAKGETTALSDLDIAFFFNRRVDFDKIYELREDLSGLLRTEVDVVVLNNASPIIRMQVLKKGAILVNKDRRAYNEFFVSTVKEYDDLKRNRKTVEDNILRGRIYA